MPAQTPGMDAKRLREEGLDWLLDATFLALLPTTDRDRLLAAATWAEHRAGDVLVVEGRAGTRVHLLVTGSVLVEVRRSREGAGRRIRLGPGHLVGERAILTRQPTVARVVAQSFTRSLCFEARDFRELLESSKALGSYVACLVALRDRSGELRDLLLRNPLVRLLGEADLQRLLQSCTLEQVPPGATIVAAGERTRDVYILVSGRVAVYPAGRGSEDAREMLATKGPGWLFGQAAAMLGLPRTADVVASQPSEVLRIDAAAFLELVRQNPRVHRLLVRQLGALELPVARALEYREQAMLVSVYGAAPRLGTTTLSYGLSRALAETGARVVLLDLAGTAGAVRPSAGALAGRVAGVETLRPAIPESWGFDVMWPRDRSRTVALMKALRASMPARSFVVVSASLQSRQDADATREADVVVFVNRGPDETWEVPERRGQVRLDVVRVGAAFPGAGGGTVNTVRLLDDGAAARSFRATGDVRALTRPGSRMGRACRRVARALLGDTVGLALGGGGAWGFGHVGLLRSLEAEGIPVDYVSGTSFGALVAGIYAAAGLEGLDLLVARRRRLLLRVGQAMLHAGGVERFVDELIGPVPSGATEIPFLPVAADVISGREIVFTEGTVGRCVQASSGMPLFFPSLHLGPTRLVDGGVLDNVPAAVAWSSGAGFVIASNVIPRVPPEPAGRSRPLGPLWRVFERVDDLQRSLYLMMWRDGRDRARVADYLFEARLERFGVHQFLQGEAIAEEARRQAAEIAGEIRRAWKSDRWLPPGRDARG